jgi:RNA polymerase sigma factor (sigma-70 family)
MNRLDDLSGRSASEWDDLADGIQRLPINRPMSVCYAGRMNHADPRHPVEPPGCASFPTTRWGIVLAARDRATSEGRAALEVLCGSNWYPVYAFVRRKGHAPDLAADLVQGFFARLLEKGGLGAVDPDKGRFRSFLMASCSHYLANHHDRERTRKRGGRPAVSLDADEAERRYRLEPSHDLTPERLYLRRWATTLLDRVLDRLRDEMAREGKGLLFESLKPALLGEGESVGYRELGSLAGLSEGAARVAAHRMRSRYREMLRDEVAATIVDASEVDQEIRDLFTALAE